MISRALLFGALAVFITVVYVAIVVGIGAIVGSRADPILSAVGRHRRPGVPAGA